MIDQHKKSGILAAIVNKAKGSQNHDPLAHLAELVDALVLGTSDFGRGSSSLPVGII